MKKVFVTDRSWPSYDEFVRRVADAGGTAVFASAQDEATLIREGADAEIVALAHRIDTYDISIEPYEDCCTVFTPRHPRTRPTLHLVETAEKNLDVEALLEDCLAQVEVRHL